MAIDSTRPPVSATAPLLKLGGGDAPLPLDRTLEALVMKKEGTTLTLAIAGKVVEAQSTLQLIAGMKVMVRVEEENGKQLLRLVTPDDPATLKAEQALLQALPRQAPLGELFQRIAQFAATTSAAMPAAPSASATTTPGVSATPFPTAGSVTTAAELHAATPSGNSSAPPADTARLATQTTAAPNPQRLAEALLRTLPSLTQLSTAQGVRQALLDSGLFMEQKLASGTDPGLRNDLKANLLRLVQQLVPATPGTHPSQAASPGQTPTTPDEHGANMALLQLLKDGEAALARIQLHQLTTLQQRESPELQWLFEIPLRTAQQHEVLELRIQRELRGSGEQHEPCWSVTLQMLDAQQQPLRAVVTLLGGAISTTFWAARAETAEQFRNQLDTLQARLATQGLQVGRLDSFVGQPPAVAHITRPSSGVLSEKA